ncbi:MAG: hypothetical protein GTN76_05745 [Candidatus Aenigmarchaeota archaeon]|nr:hypothetical protein [Candidatus Aenigmarchaeota archaeon]
MNVKEVKKQLLRIVRAKINHRDQVPVILLISNYHPDQVPVILSISNYRRDQVPVFDGNHKNRLWFIPGTADLSREKPTAPGPLGTNKIYKRRFKYE